MQVMQEHVFLIGAFEELADHQVVLDRIHWCRQTQAASTQHEAHHGTPGKLFKGERFACKLVEST